MYKRGISLHISLYTLYIMEKNDLVLNYERVLPDHKTDHRPLA